MKQTNLTKPLLVATLLLCSLYTNAYSFSATNDDGVTIYYNILSSSEKTVEVTYGGARYSATDSYVGDVVIPETVSYGSTLYSVTTIGERAFEYCTDLTSIYIPNSVTAIGISAFSNCTGLTGELKIPDSVTTIGSYAFFFCQSLTSLDLGKSVTLIGDYAFSDCRNMKKIYSYNSVPPVCGSDAFDITYQYSVLYVPAGSYDAYKQADEWKRFSIIYAELDGIESVSADGAEVVGYYTIDGKAVDAPQRGVNIVRYSDGTTRKILVQ